MPLVLAHWTQASKITFPVQPSQGTGQIFSSAAAYAGLGQLFLLSHPWGWLTHVFTIRASCTVLPRQGAGSALVSAAVSKGQGQHTCFHDPQH